MSSYMDSYQNSLNQSRSQINQQLQQALGQIQQQQAAANQAVATLPGQFSDVYGRSQNALTQYGGQLDSAQKASGIGSFAPSSSFLAPVQQAMGGSLDYLKSEVPMMKLGVDQGYAGLQNQARGTAATLEGQLDTEQRGYLSAMAQEQAREQAARDSSAMQNAWQAQQNELNRQANLQDIYAQQGGAGGINPADTSFYQKQAQSVGIAPTQYAMITADPAFARARQLAVGQFANNPGAQMQVVRHISQKYGIDPAAAQKLLGTPNAAPYNPARAVPTIFGHPYNTF